MFIIVNHSVDLLTAYLQNIFIQFTALNLFTCYNWNVWWWQVFNIYSWHAV